MSMIHFFMRLSPLLFLTFLHFSVHADVTTAVQKLESRVNSIKTQKDIPGLAVGVVGGGKVIFSKGFGVRNKNTNEPVTPKTVFQLGSVSKGISGTLMGILIAQKKIHLHNKLKESLPKHTFAHEGITVSHVVSHTTGIPRTGFNPLIESEKKTRDEIHEQIGRTALTCEPGTCYNYNNAVFSLIDPIIEHHLGMSFEDTARMYLFNPLGMNSTSANHESLIGCTNRASPHLKTKNGSVACKHYRTGYYEVAPAGGINANLEDMLKFLEAQLGHHPEVLSPEILKLIHTPITSAPDIFERNPYNHSRFKSSSYGIGWRILDYKGTKIVFHGGWLKGFLNMIAFIPEKDIGIVILQNTETSAPWIIAMSFFDDVLGNPEKNWETKPVAAKVTTKIAKSKNVKITTPAKSGKTPHSKQKKAPLSLKRI